MKISGRLTGKDSSPLSGVHVQILDDGGEISKALSNSQGRFECPVADTFADRPLKLLAQRTGYQPFQKDIQCAADTNLGDLVYTGEAITPPVPVPPVPVPPVPRPLVPPPASQQPQKRWWQLLLKPEGPWYWKVFDAILVLLFLFFSTVLWLYALHSEKVRGIPREFIAWYLVVQCVLTFRVGWRLTHPK